MAFAKIARIIRQNHALEHAVISMLTDNGETRQIVARSDWSGFSVYGSVSTEALRRAAHEGLTRLKAGDMTLALHPRCGTNLAVNVLLSGMAAYTVSALKTDSRLARMQRMLMAILGATIIARPLGTWAQRHVTTTTDLSDVLAIGEIRREDRGGVVSHHVSIVRESDALRAPALKRPS
jgi:hypothetical protein